MFGTRCVALIAALVMAVSVVSGDPVHAQPPVPVCRGQDLFPELAASDPATLQRVDEAARRIVNGEALLWKISRAGLAPSYLFGTIHLSDERVTALSPAVGEALQSAQTVALEVADINPQAFGAAMARLGSLLVFQDNRSLAGLLQPEERAVAGTALQKAGFPPAAHDKLKPWFVTLMLALSDCERARAVAGKQALDLQIGAKARARGVPVVGLETIDDQLGAMAAIPDADQLSMLKATLKSYSRNADLIETMLQRYLAREMSKMLPLQAEMIRAAGLDPAGFKGFQHALLTVRNPRMRDAALPILAKGGVFIAVGALHLIGDDGLVKLFRDAGYEVAAVE